MRIDVLNKGLVAPLVLMLFGFVPCVVAQDKPAANMQILREKIKAVGAERLNRAQRLNGLNGWNKA